MDVNEEKACTVTHGSELQGDSVFPSEAVASSQFTGVHAHATGVQARTERHPVSKIDDDSFHDKDCFGVLSALVDFAPQVCIILLCAKEGPDLPRGTGFYVGDGFVLTAKHVVDPSATVVKEKNLCDPIKFHANFSFECANVDTSKNVKLKKSDKVILDDENLDSIFLEMEEQQESTKAELQEGFSPKCFDFGTELPKCVHLVGHFSGASKSIDRNCKVEQAPENTVRLHLDNYYCIHWKDHKLTKEQYENRQMKDNKLLDDKKHILITCWFIHGASGSPVLHYCEQEKVVKAVALYCMGLPSNHYDRRACNKDGDVFDKENREMNLYKTFEAGLKLSVIQKAMSKSGTKPPGW